MSAPSLLALVCPHCGDALRGAQQDVVFHCTGCRRFFEAVGERYVERSGAIAAPPDGAERPGLHLPVWAFRVETRWVWQDRGPQDTGWPIPPLPWIYVTGFSVHNPSYFGDPGVIFTERRAQLAAGEEAPLFGCMRGLDAASAFVESHVLTIVDRRVDVTGLDLTCNIVEARLWGLPFVEQGDALQDCILGLRLPVGALNDLAAVRNLYKGR